MRIALPPPASGTVYEDISWPDLEAFVAEHADTRALRWTYDHGRLEIVTPGYRHEGANRLVSQLVEAACQELGIPYVCLGSSTLLRADLLRGIEPDTCYYIRNVDRIPRGDGPVLGRDPPPDLVIEVDVTRRSLPRLPIYAALGVPEVWRVGSAGVEGFGLRGARLGADRDVDGESRRSDDGKAHRREPGDESGGMYERIDHSRAFPWLLVAELTRFLEQRNDRTDLEIVEGFRAYIARRRAASDENGDADRAEGRPTP